MTSSYDLLMDALGPEKWPRIPRGNTLIQDGIRMDLEYVEQNTMTQDVSNKEGAPEEEGRPIGLHLDRLGRRVKGIALTRQVPAVTIYKGVLARKHGRKDEEHVAATKRLGNCYEQPMHGGRSSIDPEG